MEVFYERSSIYLPSVAKDHVQTGKMTIDEYLEGLVSKGTGFVDKKQIKKMYQLSTKNYKWDKKNQQIIIEVSNKPVEYKKMKNK